jgi:hypothetical protein
LARDFSEEAYKFGSKTAFYKQFSTAKASKKQKNVNLNLKKLRKKSSVEENDSSRATLKHKENFKKLNKLKNSSDIKCWIENNQSLIEKTNANAKLKKTPSKAKNASKGHFKKKKTVNLTIPKKNKHFLSPQLKTRFHPHGSKNKSQFNSKNKDQLNLSLTSKNFNSLYSAGKSSHDLRQNSRY